MTLAADGHLVKVHQVLVALASPYLKDMIASAPCPHPVIYLNVSVCNRNRMRAIRPAFMLIEFLRLR